jgi:hypothetical protein
MPLAVGDQAMAPTGLSKIPENRSAGWRMRIDEMMLCLRQETMNQQDQ